MSDTPRPVVSPEMEKTIEAYAAALIQAPGSNRHVATCNALFRAIETLEKDNTKMHKALTYIESPIAAIQADASASGSVVNGGMALSIHNDAGHLRHCATTALRGLAARPAPLLPQDTEGR